MIEFYGILSEKCIKAISKRNNIFNSLVFAIFTIISIITTLFLWLYNIEQYKYFIVLTLIMIVVNILLLIVPANSIAFRMNRKIVIDKEIIKLNIEGLNTPFKPKIRKIKKVKKVYDFGEWYYILFKWDLSDYIICQKNLLSKGSIEDFEKIFEGKIIRKKN